MTDEQKRKSTKIELVEELRALPSLNPKIDRIIKAAENGEYHDYQSTRDFPKVELVFELREAGCVDLARRVEAGEFDEEPTEEDVSNITQEYVDDIRRRVPPNERIEFERRVVGKFPPAEEKRPS
jgi:hypothetical protein